MRILAWLLVSLPMALAGCTEPALGGNAGDAAVPADLAAPPDLAVAPDLATVNPSGQPCPVGNECPMGYMCLDERLSPLLPATGYCSKMCGADADCGAGAFCGNQLGQNGPRFCFAVCDANQGCIWPGQLCGQRFAGLFDLGRLACSPGNLAARDGSPCTSFADCNRNQVCYLNPFEAPGGMCLTFGCTVGDNTTCAPGGDGVCVLGDNQQPLCADACAMSSDCRAAEGYACVAIPMTTLQLCLLSHARPGASCAKDADCGPPTTTWRCLMGPAFTGGFCSGAVGTCTAGDDSSCPNGARCYDPSAVQPGSGDEYCIPLCQTDADCRSPEGYRCLPFSLAPMSARGCRKP